MHLGRKIAVGEIIEDTGVEDVPEPAPEIVVRDEERVEALVDR